MKTIRRLIYREAATGVAFVTLAFLALFFFFDMVDELRWVGRASEAGYTLSYALLYVALSLPAHLYELLPITVLIGTIFVMARLAQSSEFTIMRTSGLGPWRALRTLLVLGCAFVIVTFAVGDYLAPLSDRAAQLVKARRTGQISAGATGAWLKERQGDHSVAVNVRALDPNGHMRGVRVFEFDAQGRIAATVQAERGEFAPDGEGWNLEGVRRSVFHHGSASPGALTSMAGGGAAAPRVERLQAPDYRWPTRISTDMVAASLLKPDKMATIDLFQYIRHLEANGQSAQKYEIEFWRKVFYPLSCLVMVVLSLPFAYLHFRSGGIAGYVFGGVMAGISFFLLNNVFGYAGNLQNWSPWLTAAAPGLIYSLLSLGAFGWLVLRR
ncbi:LPS export ABC transporter permease LptG [Acidovorax sp. FG27]|uniref:LPS export ABC transporter permease LptG n=1 Tax=Acidovorax sp. FG27 TaxID=3133652 RepID=UPI0030E7BBDF